MRRSRLPLIRAAFLHRHRQPAINQGLRPFAGCCGTQRCFGELVEIGAADGNHVGSATGARIALGIDRQGGGVGLSGFTLKTDGPHAVSSSVASNGITARHLELIIGIVGPFSELAGAEFIGEPRRECDVRGARLRIAVFLNGGGVSGLVLGAQVINAHRPRTQQREGETNAQPFGERFGEKAHFATPRHFRRSTLPTR